MDELLWVPQWPSQFSLLAACALMLAAGVLAARVLSPTLRIPEITAFLLCGLGLGPSGLALISSDSVAGLSALADLALGIVLFELGRRIDPVWLARERWALTTSIAQGLVVFLGLAMMLTSLGTTPALAMMAAALGCASSPAIILRVIQETRAEGQVTDRLAHSVAVSCLLGFVLFTIALQSLHIMQAASWVTTLAHPLYLFGGSIALGWLSSGLVSWIATRLLARRPELQRLIVFACIALLVEANDLLKLSPLVSLLIFGISSRGYGKRNALQTFRSGTTDDLVFAFLFVYLGTTLQTTFNPTVLILGVFFVALRGTLLIAVSTALSQFNGLSAAKGALWGAALLPMSGVAIVLVNHAASLYPELGLELAQLLGSALMVTHAVGPLVSWWSLRRSGEGRTDA